MIESFFLYYWFFDLIYLIIPRYSNVSSLWINFFTISSFVYLAASGLHDLENIRQMQQKTPILPIVLTSLQIVGFLLSNVFCLVYAQGYYPSNTHKETIFQGMLPTLLTFVFCIILFITACKTHRAKIENSSASLLQDCQSFKNKILFRITLFAMPIFIVVSIILSSHFHYSKF
ncbi:hypothetical protein EZS27_024340 [termite gut metagenome]|uniref:Uncharacterized protein n=1 Tax=termite gut metagenome TaxID=433724 RepID=A0A5J4QXT5_9ZZZZ